MVAPIAGLIAALIAGEPILAHFTQIFMPGAARFVAQWFPIFLLGGLFGKLMDDSGSIASIAKFLTERLGTRRTILSVVLASAIVTYGGVSVFVAFFVLVPMAQQMFQAADIPRRLMPATIGLGAFTFTMSALPGTPSINNAIPMPYFGTTTFAAPGLGIIASAITLAFGLWWLGRAEAAARRTGEGFGVQVELPPAIDEKMREQATAAGDFDPAELEHGKRADNNPPFALAALPLAVVIVTNFLMSLVVFPRLDLSFLSDPAWGGTTANAVAGVWSVIVALAAANLTVILVNFRRMPSLRQSSGRRCELRSIADADYSQPCWFRRDHRILASFRGSSGRSSLHSGRPVDIAYGVNEFAGCVDWYSLWRDGDRLERAGGPLSPSR